MPTNSIEPSLELPITLSSRTYRGRKRRVITINSTTNKMQLGLEGIASILYRRLVLVPISKNISGLVLKNYSKEIRNNRRDRRKRLLILKAIYLGI